MAKESVRAFRLSENVKKHIPILTPSVASRQLPLQVGGAFHEIRRMVLNYCKNFIYGRLMEGGKPPLRIGVFWVAPPAVGLRSSAAADNFGLFARV